MEIQENTENNINNNMEAKKTRGRPKKGQHKEEQATEPAKPKAKATPKAKQTPMPTKQKIELQSEEKALQDAELKLRKFREAEKIYKDALTELSNFKHRK